MKIRWSKWVHPNEFARARATIGSDPDMTQEEFASLATFVKPSRAKTAFVLTKGICEPATQLNFWIGETDFRITGSMSVRLHDVEGLERIIFLSRYRFRVGIGNLFNCDQVRLKIEEVLIGCHRARIGKTPEVEATPESN